VSRFRCKLKLLQCSSGGSTDILAGLLVLANLLVLVIATGYFDTHPGCYQG